MFQCQKATLNLPRIYIYIGPSWFWEEPHHTARTFQCSFFGPLAAPGHGHCRPRWHWLSWCPSWRRVTATRMWDSVGFALAIRWSDYTLSTSPPHHSLVKIISMCKLCWKTLFQYSTATYNFFWHGIWARNDGHLERSDQAAYPWVAKSPRPRPAGGRKRFDKIQLSDACTQKT